MYGAMLGGSGRPMTSAARTARRVDVRGRFPEVYRISKYNGMGRESNRDRKQTHIK